MTVSSFVKKTILFLPGNDSEIPLWVVLRSFKMMRDLRVVVVVHCQLSPFFLIAWLAVKSTNNGVVLYYMLPEQGVSFRMVYQT